MKPALLVAMPSGLITSGVAAWGVRACNIVAASGGNAGIILHAPTPGYRPIAMELDPRVRRYDASGLPAIDGPGGVRACVGLYRDAVRELSDVSGGPVVLSPNLVGDCYGVASALCVTEAERVRIAGWLHNDIPYEYRVQRHYEPVISVFVPVSRRIEGELARQVPSRRGDIVRVAYGVPVPERCPGRSADGRAMRIVYAGRLDHAQKRVLSVVHMSRLLKERGVAHELLIVGDGPAGADVTEAIAGQGQIARHSSVTPQALGGLFERADVFVLGSRHEGLSIAVMEAMSRGVVPVVCRTASGAAELIEDGVSGVLVECAESAGDEEAGRALAAGVEGLAGRLAEMSVHAHARAGALYSIAAHATALMGVLERCQRSPARAWDPSRACAFGGQGGGGSGSVPPDGAERLRGVLETLAGRRVVIHGAGRHTVELGGVLCASPAGIVAFTDDDPSRWGAAMWGWPVIDPAKAAETGATDVVISSWINQRVIVARSGAMYERQGLRVHTLYEA